MKNLEKTEHFIHFQLKNNLHILSGVGGFATHYLDEDT